MAPRIYALLAGVNDYTPNVGKLNGCLNDVDHYHDYLKSNFDPSRLAIEVRKDSETTRQGIIDGFRNHLGQAGPNDIVLFQFAGHGARWKAAHEFNEFYPDGFDEGLICWDSRREPEKPGSFDFADKELAVLVSEVAEKSQHVVVILDCCHSGSGTRSADDFAQAAVRMSHQIEEERPLESYLDGYYQRILEKGDSLKTPTSRHILLAACERKKQAFENYDRRGIFSSSLLDTLDSCGGITTYADLFVRVRATVKRIAYNQIPQFEVARGFNARAGFLGCEIPHSSKTRFHVNFNPKADSWSVACGAIQGIMSQPDQPIELAIFKGVNDEVSIGIANPTSVGLAKSEIDLNFETRKDQEYFAEVTSLPAPPMMVSLQGDPAGKKFLEDYLASDESFCDVKLIEDPDARFEYTLSAEDYADEGPCYLLTDSRSGRLIQGVRGYSKTAAEQIISVLEHIATWENTLALQNHSNEADLNLIPFQFVEIDSNGNEAEYGSPRIRFDLSDDEVVRGKLRTKNSTSQQLYSMLVYFSNDYGMYVLDNDEFPAVDAWRTILLDGEPELQLMLDQDGLSQAIERFMLIVSNERIDEFLLGPPDQRICDSDGNETNAVLEPIELGKIQSVRKGREVRTGKQKIKEVDWFTKTIEIELVRICGRVSSQDVTIADGKIRVKGHPKLKANISMNPFRIGGQIAGNDDADFCRALESGGLSMLSFLTSRGENMSVLEFAEIENPTALADQPLEIEIDVQLNEDEKILPITFDGECILLAGEAVKDETGTTCVRIDHIPEILDHRRSALSSLKIYFFKSKHNREDTTQPGRVDVNEDGTVSLQLLRP